MYTFDIKFSMAIGIVLFVALECGMAREIVILQTADVHARVDDKNGCGWLRLSTAIQDERRKADGKCIWIDCGDAIQGTFSASICKGAGSILALKKIGVDVWVPGNHEFDFGGTLVKKIFLDKSLNVVNGNVSIMDSAPPSYRIIERNGLKIAVIGMNNPRLPLWFVGQRYKKLEMTPIVKKLERILPKLMKKLPDLVVLAIHEGRSYGKKRANVIAEVAKRFPQIKLILGGHTHVEVPGKRLWGALFVQPGCHGKYLAKVIVTFDSKKKIVNVRSKLIDVTTYEPDEKLKRDLIEFTEKAYGVGKTIVRRSTKSIYAKGIPGKNNQLSEIVCRSIKRAASVDVVLHGVHNAYGIKGKKITKRKIFYAIPYENDVIIVTMTKKELTEVIAEQITLVKKKIMQGPYGIHVWLDSDMRIVRIGDDDKKEYSVAVNSYCAAGAGGRMPKLRETIMKHPILELKKNTRELLTEFLETDNDWDAPPTTWLHFKKKYGASTLRRTKKRTTKRTTK